jgi:hypothetical protein
VKTRGHAGQSMQHAVVNHGVSRCSLDGACSMVIPHFAQMRPSRGGSDVCWSELSGSTCGWHPCGCGGDRKCKNPANASSSLAMFISSAVASSNPLGTKSATGLQGFKVTRDQPASSRKL